MSKIAKGRPPQYIQFSLRMKRTTKRLLIALARDTGMKQGRLIELGLKEVAKQLREASA